MKLLICVILLYVPFLSHSKSNHKNPRFPHIRRGGGIAANSDAVEYVDVQTKKIADPVTSDLNENEAWRNSLPTQLQNRRGALHKILVPTRAKQGTTQSAISDDKETCEVYLLGTAHVSKDSCMDVQLLMDHVQPDVLFIELCDQRLAVLDDTPLVIPNNSDDSVKKSVGVMVKEIMVHNPDMSRAAALSSVLLTNIQNDYATKLGVTIGGEFREAYKKAKAQQEKFNGLVERLRWEQNQYATISEDTLQKARSSNGCSIVLGDRPVRLTLLRAWEALSFFGKIKLVLALMWSSLRQPTDEELRAWMESIMNDPTNDILTKSIDELSKHFPAVKQTIIEERDTYMACKILQTVRILGDGSARDGAKRKIVVVVGAGHCPGIIKILLNERGHSTGINSTQISVETELRKVIETKKYKIEDPHVMSLVTEVVSMDPVA